MRITASIVGLLLCGPVLGACSATPDDVSESAAAISVDTGKRVHLVPLDEETRLACGEEDTQYYCDEQSASAAAARCSAGSRKVRFDTRAGSCTSAAPVYPDAAACRTPIDKNCAFYLSCIEEQTPCGRSGYAEGYGEKYCYRFLNETGFSDRANRWRDATLTCLQKELVPFVGAKSASCQTIVDAAFDSHPRCYTQEGASICDLSLGDVRKIAFELDATDVLSVRSAKQITKVAATCAQHVVTRILGGIGSIFGGHRMDPMDEAELQDRYVFWHAVEIGQIDTMRDPSQMDDVLRASRLTPSALPALRRDQPRWSTSDR